MSVFQLHDWWRVKVAGEKEEFDHGCMALGNVDNAYPPSNKIVLGSQQGIIRIFNPSKADYRVEDLILEENLVLPILSVAIGRFIPSLPDSCGLAVLHPRKLVVFELVPQGNIQSGKISYYSLSRLYEHNLGIEGKHFTAYNMIHGAFGGVSGKDMIVVQSMDGKLQFFDQTAEAFTRQLVDCLIPACMLYSRRLDAFIMSNYACRVECYRYQVLVNAQSDIGTSTENTNRAKANNSGASFGLTAVRSAMVEWSLNVGEGVLQILNGKFLPSISSDGLEGGGGGEGAAGGNEAARRGSLTMKNNIGSTANMPEEFLVVCEWSVFLVKETGVMIQHRKLEREAVCATVYSCPASTAGSSVYNNFILLSRDGTLQIFSEFLLVWAVKMEHATVQLAVSDFGGVRGLVTTIDEYGSLTIGYLGTKPPVAAVGGANQRELDYDKIDSEHRSLLQVIRDLHSDTKPEAKETLTIRSQAPRGIDRDADLGGLALPEDAVFISAQGVREDHLVKATFRLSVSFNGAKPASNVCIRINTPAFMYAMPSSISLNQVIGSRSTPTVVTVVLLANRSFVPSSLEVKVLATYTLSNGEPRVASHTFLAPLILACRLRPALKTNTHKLTLELSDTRNSFPLNELFKDFLSANQETSGGDLGDVLDASGGAMSLGFQFWTNSCSLIGDVDPAASASSGLGNATIIASKAGGRYRVQADSLALLGVVCSELVRRLSMRVREIGGSSSAPSDGKPKRFLPVGFPDNLPLDGYFSIIQDHYSTRQKCQEYLSQMNDLSHQYRMIEKRLLMRFKEKTPSPLGGLDVILKETFMGLTGLGDKVETSKAYLRKLSAEMESTSRLMALLAHLKFDTSPLEHAQLEAYLCPDLQHDGTEQGWEEVVDASLTYILRTSLAKNSKETAMVSTQMEPLDNVDKLTKHIGIVFDRLSKGARIVKLKVKEAIA